MEIFQITTGIITILFVLINFILGIKIASTYRNRKNINYLYVGIAWLGIAFPLIPDILQFFFSFFSPEISDFSLIVLYALFNIIIIPIVVLLWLTALTNLLHLKNRTKKIILLVYGIFAIIMEILIVSFIFIEINMIGKIGDYPYQVVWSPLSDIVLISSLSIVLITGFLFARELLRSMDKEVKLRGQFLLLAFITFVVGNIVEILFTTPESNIIARSILILSSIEFYIGLTMPNFAKRFFFKD
ncbi:MAG: conserved membrane protein of unknown function [Promethearchaeota archaeon]|nr:MAG: conserved membrane protein of unknown function [Candidatus Lokiarchaeota archaeon]